jgi:hypothetical protein
MLINLIGAPRHAQEITDAITTETTPIPKNRSSPSQKWQKPKRKKRYHQGRKTIGDSVSSGAITIKRSGSCSSVG